MTVLCDEAAKTENAMSWMPAQEPILGDKRTCDALDLIIVPRVRDLGGGFSVHRALPHAKRQMVGPFIFFDQMGPVQLMLMPSLAASVQMRMRNGSRSRAC
jgi:hypothetical protein